MFFHGRVDPPFNISISFRVISMRMKSILHIFIFLTQSNKKCVILKAQFIDRLKEIAQIAHYF